MALTLGDNFSYQGAKPLDARLKYDTVATMKAVEDATMYEGCLAYCTETDKTYQWKSSNTSDSTLGKWREFSSGGESISIDNALSTTSENPVQNKVVTKAIADSKDYIEGYINTSDGKFYKDSAYTEEIELEEGKLYLDIASNRIARWDGASFTVLNSNDFDDLINRPVEAEDIDLDGLVMPSKPVEYPVLFDERGTEYVVGYYVNSEGKRKPVYKKTIDCGQLSNKSSVEVDHGIEDLDNIVYMTGTALRGDGPVFPLPYTHDLSVSAQINISADNTRVYTSNRGYDFSSFHSYITLRYTKTTDEWEEV